MYKNLKYSSIKEMISRIHKWYSTENWARRASPFCVYLSGTLDSPVRRSRTWVEWARMGTARTSTLPGKSYSEGNTGGTKLWKKQPAQEIQTSHSSISFIHFLNAEEEPGRGDVSGLWLRLESHLYPCSICLVDRLFTTNQFLSKTQEETMCCFYCFFPPKYSVTSYSIF